MITGLWRLNDRMETAGSPLLHFIQMSQASEKQVVNVFPEAKVRKIPQKLISE